MLTKSRLLGMNLRDGAIRPREVIHNGGWYSSTGEKIGWGDLDEHDFNNIQENLAEGELFVVLPESASFWEFVTQHAAFGSLCKTKPEERNPGQEYIIEHASRVIAKDKMYCCGRFEDREEIGTLIRGGK